MPLLEQGHGISPQRLNPLAGVEKMHDDINKLIQLALLPIFPATTEGVNYGRS